tara:strand:- start:565 stop:720 length:156 start_codon:yes stop_codon:yes gene_type:complete
MWPENLSESFVVLLINKISKLVLISLIIMETEESILELDVLIIDSLYLSVK